jgi:hypothetical protein
LWGKEYKTPTKVINTIYNDVVVGNGLTVLTDISGCLFMWSENGISGIPKQVEELNDKTVSLGKIGVGNGFAFVIG